MYIIATVLLFFYYYSKTDYEVLNLYKIQEFIDMGRLTPKADGFITMRDLLATGIISQVRDGVKLLAKVRQSNQYETLKVVFTHLFCFVHYCN